MVRRVSTACGRLRLASRMTAALLAFFCLAALPGQAQSPPVLARARSWIGRRVSGLESRLTPRGGNAFRFGRDLVVNDGESLDDAACFLCSTHINGQAQGDLLVFAGNAYLNGAVHGDVIDLGGRVTLTSKARIGGDLIVFGGRLQQDPAGTIGGKRLLVGPIVFLPLILIIGVVIAGLIFLLRILFGRFGTEY